ncbi:unnamed protein product [Strongylus vulgaris]|uniref:Transthyretin-like family protein n=1 Tax=Strongylus vulgaris TaxID=40348 RepID=A0A3P7L740_STRVU|nr:unnamed protein product [Strongylus vulgaris]
MKYLLLCALLGYATAIELFGRDQSSAVRGQLMCDGRPAVGVKVKLWDPCQRKFSILIPDSYVSHGKVPKKVYDAGTIQLAGSFPGESRDCIN